MGKELRGCVNMRSFDLGITAMSAAVRTPTQAIIFHSQPVEPLEKIALVYWKEHSLAISTLLLSSLFKKAPALLCHRVVRNECVQIRAFGN